MKLLLLSDVPPCSDLTGGLVLAQQCRFVDQGSLVNFCLLDPSLDPQPFDDLSWIPTRAVEKPNENGVWDVRGVNLGWPLAFAVEMRKRLLHTKRLVQQVIDFGREHEVDALWVMMQGQTIARLAVPVAQGLGVPLYTQVWDPISWWTRTHNIDPLNSRLAQRDFEGAIKNSEACATASWAMAERYEADFGTRCVPVIAGLREASLRVPATAPRNDSELVIGMAGQFYAGDAWDALKHALDLAEWQIAGRKVRVVTMGRYPPSGNFPMHVLDHKGWVAQEDAIRILAEDCDVLYCPYPFDRDAQETSDLSFPSKLVSYFAAGRPVFFHGPQTSSPSRYLREYGAGVCVSSLEAPAITNALSLLANDQESYRRLAANGAKAFERDFSLAAMERSFAAFLGK